MRIALNWMYEVQFFNDGLLILVYVDDMDMLSEDRFFLCIMLVYGI